MPPCQIHGLDEQHNELIFLALCYSSRQRNYKVFFLCCFLYIYIYMIWCFGPHIWFRIETSWQELVEILGILHLSVTFQNGKLFGGKEEMFSDVHQVHPVHPVHAERMPTWTPKAIPPSEEVAEGCESDSTSSDSDNLQLPPNELTYSDGPRARNATSPTSPTSHEDVAVRDVDVDDDSDDLTLPPAELKLSRRWAKEKEMKIPIGFMRLVYYVYLPAWMVDFHGKCRVNISVPWILSYWLVGSGLSTCTWCFFVKWIWCFLPPGFPPKVSIYRFLFLIIGKR